MTDGVVTSELRSFVDRLVRLAENKKAIAEDEKTVCSEAKDKGYDLPALKQVVKEQLMDEKQLDAANEQTEMVALYREKLGSQSFGDICRQHSQYVLSHPDKPQRDMLAVFLSLNKFVVIAI